MTKPMKVTTRTHWLEQQSCFFELLKNIANIIIREHNITNNSKLSVIGFRKSCKS